MINWTLLLHRGHLSLCAIIAAPRVLCTVSAHFWDPRFATACQTGFTVERPLITLPRNGLGRRMAEMRRAEYRPCLKHSIGGWPDSPQSRSRAIRYPFFGTVKSAPDTRELGRSGWSGRIGAETASSSQGLIGHQAGRMPAKRRSLVGSASPAAIAT